MYLPDALRDMIMPYSHPRGQADNANKYCESYLQCLLHKGAMTQNMLMELSLIVFEANLTNTHLKGLKVIGMFEVCACVVAAWSFDMGLSWSLNSSEGLSQAHALLDEEMKTRRTMIFLLEILRNDGGWQRAQANQILMRIMLDDAAFDAFYTNANPPDRLVNAIAGAAGDETRMTPLEKAIPEGSRRPYSLNLPAQGADITLLRDMITEYGNHLNKVLRQACMFAGMAASYRLSGASLDSLFKRPEGVRNQRGRRNANESFANKHFTALSCHRFLESYMTLPTEGHHENGIRILYAILTFRVLL